MRPKNEDRAAERAAAFALPADLSQAAARESRAELLDQLTKRPGTEIELVGEDATPSAIQLLASVRAMADRDALPIVFGDRATRALARLGGAFGTGG